MNFVKYTDLPLKKCIREGEEQGGSVRGGEMRERKRERENERGREKGRE